MSLLKTAKLRLASRRLSEETAYAQVLREIESGVRNDGLWAKAISLTTNKEELIASYIKLRVQSLRDEAELDSANNAQFDEANSRIRIEESKLKKKRLEEAEAQEKEREWLSKPLAERKRITKNRLFISLFGAFICGGIAQLSYHELISPPFYIGIVGAIIVIPGTPLFSLAAFLYLIQLWSLKQ